MSRKSKTQSIMEVIETVEKKNTTVEDYTLKLEKTNFALNETINKLVKKIADAEEEIAHLREMLFKSTPTVTGEGILAPMSDEELIAGIQLKKLSEKAKVSELSLEDIKRFDLLVKNKRLAQGDATTIEGTKLPNLPTNKLVHIASQKKTEEK